MPNKTSKYKLNQWVPEDTFLRTDFNSDNATLESALTGLQNSINSLQTTVNSHIQPVFGTYAGNQSESASTKQTITLGYKPKAVLVVRANGQWQNGSNCFCGLTYDGNTHSCGIAITSSGFTVQNINTQPYRYLNTSGVNYVYMVFR